MKCSVLLFAGLAEIAGVREVTIELDAHATAADALDELAKRNAAMAPILSTAAVAVDESYVSRETELTAGCTIAIIPPVSGG